MNDQSRLCIFVISEHMLTPDNLIAQIVQMRNSGQADRRISTGQLNMLPCLHTRPINLVVFQESHARSSFEGGFALICLQRLSFPDVATLRCR